MDLTIFSENCIVTVTVQFIPCYVYIIKCTISLHDTSAQKIELIFRLSFTAHCDLLSIHAELCNV